MAGIMEAGLLLHNAKEELAAAEFWQMANERLRFSQKTIYKLIKIGTDPKLMEVAHARLPAGWYTLWLLAGLTDEQFQHGLDAGIIHAGMERADVKLLKPSIWALETGAWPVGELDHTGGLAAGNGRANLRPATRSQNLANTAARRNSRSGVKGVFWDIRRGKWCAKITVRGRQSFLGYFEHLADAKMAYADAATKHFGAFARL